MTHPAAGWHPDPTHRHELRYWDGSRWTVHVMSTGVAGTDQMTPSRVATDSAQARRRVRRLGWTGLLLSLVAITAVAVPATSYAVASSEKSVTLDGRAKDVTLPPDTAYGIYVDDADNSGYSQSCSIRDADGEEVPVSYYPPARFSMVGTETLDMTFNTGSGQLSISCSVPGERVSARPAPAQRPIVIGAVIAVVVGATGAASLIAWLVQRRERTT